MDGNPLRKFVPGNAAANEIKRETGAIPDNHARGSKTPPVVKHSFSFVLSGPRERHESSPIP